MKHEYAHVNGIKLHYVTEGEGPLLILLHGFPQNWFVWRHHIHKFAKSFRVVAPDLRGYGESDKPQEVAAYQTKIAAKDIYDLIHALGEEKAFVVGHDWGGSVAWKLAEIYPEAVEKLVVLNSPHPAIMGKALKSNFTQMKKSWYIFYFQIPYLPEYLIQKDVRGFLAKIFKNPSVKKGTYTQEDLELYAKALEKPGSLTPILNYYRAAFRFPAKPPFNKIQAPTLLIWGENDAALGKELTYKMEPYFLNGLEIVYLPASHWVVEEEPEHVGSLIKRFIEK